MADRRPLARLALAAAFALAPLGEGPLAQPAWTAPLASPSAGDEREAPRHAADERFFLTPSARVLEKDTFVLADDEALLFHLGWGAASRLQLDLTLGALPVPGAAGGAVPAHGLIAGGGAGVVVLGVVMLGAKVQVLEEGRVAPGVAVAYDFVDLFGGAIGGAGLVVLGNGVAGAGVGGIGAANIQLNVFSLAVNKHVGRRLLLGAGTFVLDNHHFVPQVTAFSTATTSGSTASGTATIDRLPTEVAPFLDGEVWLGGGFSSIAELFPRAAGETFGTVGLRWVSGRQRRTGISSIVRAKLDAALVLGHTPDTSVRDGRFVVLPWLGVALYLF